jgi:hypothetical protein
MEAVAPAARSNIVQLLTFENLSNQTIKLTQKTKKKFVQFLQFQPKDYLRNLIKRQQRHYLVQQ